MSYLNAYIANGAVIMPGYDQPRDAEAVKSWQRIYPEREPVQVQISDTGLGGAGTHCITPRLEAGPPRWRPQCDRVFPGLVRPTPGRESAPARTASVMVRGAVGRRSMA